MANVAVAIYRLRPIQKFVTVRLYEIKRSNLQHNFIFGMFLVHMLKYSVLLILYISKTLSHFSCF